MLKLFQNLPKIWFIELVYLGKVFNKNKFAYIKINTIFVPMKAIDKLRKYLPQFTWKQENKDSSLFGAITNPQV